VKSKINNITKMGMLMALTAIAALCMAPPVRAASFYATVTNVTQLIADINYANTFGGTYTIYLQPNTTFTNGALVIGGTNTVHLTIIGNGDTFTGPGLGQYVSRFFAVAAGSSLTLEQMTLQNGCVYVNYGGAIYNSGTLTISNCTLSGNTSVDRTDYVTSLRGVGGAIYNSGGTVIIDNSILSDNLATGANPMGGAIYNASGTVTISNSTFTNNSATDTVGGIYVDPEYPQDGAGGAIFNESGMVTISHSSLTGNYASFMGGGICNGFYYYIGGTVTVENSSKISGNTVDDVQNSGVLYLDSTSTISILDGYSAIGVSPVLSINSWSSTAHQLVLSWRTNSTGYTLQSSTDLGSTNWTNCASPTVSGAYYVVTNSMSAGAQFFRLKR
jgi:hypothetical protein